MNKTKKELSDEALNKVSGGSGRAPTKEELTYILDRMKEISFYESRMNEAPASQRGRRIKLICRNKIQKVKKELGNYCKERGIDERYISF